MMVETPGDIGLLSRGDQFRRNEDIMSTKVENFDATKGFI